jgi:hypothetical protein
LAQDSITANVRFRVAVVSLNFNGAITGLVTVAIIRQSLMTTRLEIDYRTA